LLGGVVIDQVEGIYGNVLNNVGVNYVAKVDDGKEMLLFGLVLMKHDIPLVDIVVY
jgi:hypothetical protein